MNSLSAVRSRRNDDNVQPLYRESEDLTEKLRSLFAPIEPQASELAMLAQAREWLSSDALAPFLIRWGRALESLGTPLDLISGQRIQQLLFTLDRSSFLGVALNCNNNARRNELKEIQKPVVPDKAVADYGIPLDIAHCYLCQTVVRSIDCDAGPAQRPSDRLLDLGSHILVPNRYPFYPGHSLLMPKAHDLSRQTLGRVLSAQELELWMKVGDELDSVVFHNHPHDGMSIPQHDHCHLIPRGYPLESILEILRSDYGDYSASVRVIVSRSTPFTHVVLTAPTRRELADAAAPLLESFEKQGLICTFAYSGKFLFISHRNDNAASGTKLKLGAGASMLGMDLKDGEIDPSALSYRQQLPRVPRLGEGEISVSIQEDRPPRPARYQPLRYSKLQPFGSGGNIKNAIGPQLWNLWQMALPFQGKCCDIAHAESVSLFALQMAALEHATEHECRVAVIAGMLHDIGWSQIKKIDSTPMDTPQIGSAGEAAIALQLTPDQLAHQEFGVRLARELLSATCWDRVREEVCAIIGDHDSRVTPSTGLACSILWDADMIWRVIYPGIMAAMAQAGDRDLATILESRRIWSDPKFYHTAAAKIMAPLEFQRTVEMAKIVDVGEEMGPKLGD